MPIWIFLDPISFMKHVGHCLWEIPHFKYAGINWHVSLLSELSSFLNLLDCKGQSINKESKWNDFDTTRLQVTNFNVCASSVILLTSTNTMSQSAETSSKPCSSYGIRATCVLSAVSLCHSLLSNYLSPRKIPLVFCIRMPHCMDLTKHESKIRFTKHDLAGDVLSW